MSFNGSLVKTFMVLMGVKSDVPNAMGLNFRARSGEYYPLKETLIPRPPSLGHLLTSQFPRAQQGPEGLDQGPGFNIHEFGVSSSTRFVVFLAIFHRVKSYIHQSRPKDPLFNELGQGRTLIHVNLDVLIIFYHYAI
jgi:hypothetical protein